MPRPFVGETGLAAAAERSEFVHLLEFEFFGGAVRLNTGAHDLVTNPYAVRIGNDVGRYLIRNPVGTWPTTEFSIEFWGRLDTDADLQNANVAISYAGSSPGTPDEFVIGVFASSGLMALTLQMDAVFTQMSFGSYPDDAAWHHIVVTWLSSGGAVRFYRDGVLVHSATLASGTTLVGGGAVVLGQEQDSVGGGFNATQAWQGELDDVRVYRRVLSAAEVLEHFQRKFVNEQKLVAHWGFDMLAAQELDNPGFESGSTGWALVPGATIVQDGNARTGTWALKYATDGVGGPNVINNRRLKVKPGDQVFMEAWLKGVGSAGTTSLAVRWVDANNVFIGSRESVGQLVGPVAAYTVIRGITGPAPLTAVYAAFDIGENNADNTTTPWYADDCFMALSVGVDQSTVGNHLTPVGITTSVTDSPFVRREWEAIGGLLEFGGIEETNDFKGQGVDVKLSGVDQTILAVLLNNQYRGRLVRIWRVHLDSVKGTLIADPVLLFQGLQLNPYTVEQEQTRDGGTVRISTRLVGMLGVERLRGIQTNLVSHQHYFEGDLFFQHTASLANTKIYWGTSVPRVGGQRRDPRSNR